MRARLIAWLFVGALVVSCLGCDGGEYMDAPPHRTHFPLTIWNRSEFGLLGILTHETSSYSEATNLLSNELADEDRFLIQNFKHGHYVTVVRQTVEAGKKIALTTAWGLNFWGDFTLVVFQESFRLEENWPEDDGGPLTEGGDAGPEGDGDSDPGD